MSSFFTIPKSQKRKRNDGQISTVKRQRPGSGASHKLHKSQAEKDDDSISESESNSPGDEGYESARSGFSDEKETAAEKRLRLAEEYLQSLRDEAEEEVGFDAEQIDRDLIAERLKEDVAESKGKLYRYVASSYSWRNISGAFFVPREDATTTAVTSHGQYIYTATKDLTITKWRIPVLQPAAPSSDDQQKDIDIRANTAHPELSKAKRRKLREKRRKERLLTGETLGGSWSDGPKKVKSCRGSHHRASDRAYQHHVAAILCLACSPDGRLLVSGGADRRLIVWDAETLVPRRVFTQHRAAVTSLAFRRNSNQLFSASADRTIKVWSLDELAYVETLFGHQDEVYDVSALGMERCVSVGGRDRTARVWKVVEETQLVFRGGGSSAEKESKKEKRGRLTDSEQKERRAKAAYGEGSIDRVVLIDDEIFITGSDNGSLSLWSVQKKKPVYTVPLAHGLDPPLPREKVFADLEISKDAEVPGPPLPRWITALVALPYSDLVLSGSWDGSIKVWQVSQDKKKLTAVTSIGCQEMEEIEQQTGDLKLASPSDHGSSILAEKVEDAENGGKRDTHVAKGERYRAVKGVINDLVAWEEGDRGKEILLIAAGVGKEHRLGRWLTRPGKNGAHLLAVPKSSPA